MTIKHFLLLLIFVLNSTATVLVDSFHIELDTHSDSAEHQLDHKKAQNKNATSNDTEHCSEFDECHNGHFHHFISQEYPQLVKVLFNNSPRFVDKDVFYTSNSLEIIKPPLLQV